MERDGGRDERTWREKGHRFLRKEFYNIWMIIFLKLTLSFVSSKKYSLLGLPVAQMIKN